MSYPQRKIDFIKEVRPLVKEGSEPNTEGVVRLLLKFAADLADPTARREDLRDNLGSAWEECDLVEQLVDVAEYQRLLSEYEEDVALAFANHTLRNTKSTKIFENIIFLDNGGFGVVCRAAELVGLTGEVVLKFIFPRQVEGPDSVLREALNTAGIEHPNLVVVRDVRMDNEEQPSYGFIEMDYVNGPSLARRLRESNGILAYDETARIIEGAARGVAALHAAGIVHRDLKPANILLDQSGKNSGFPMPKVVDFGLSAKRNESAGVSGTPYYMSPEQWRGDRADAPADVWSLGVLLYECLTGKRPFDGDAAREVLEQVKQGNFTPPSKLVEGTPVGLEEICLKCLSEEPDERPSAEELANRIQNWWSPRDLYLPDPYYLPTEADYRAFAALKDDERMIIIKGPIYSGKRSLLTRLIQTRREDGYLVIEIDFSDFGYIVTEARAGKTALREAQAEFLQRLFERIGRAFDRKESRLPTTAYEAGNEMESLLSEAVERSVVLAIHNADAIYGAGFENQAFGMFRGWYNKANENGWRRLRLMLTISYEPQLLIPGGAAQSPFNVGCQVELKPFEKRECLELRRRYVEIRPQSEKQITEDNVSELYELLEGHRALTIAAYRERVLPGSEFGRMPFEDFVQGIAREEGPLGSLLRRLWLDIQRDDQLKECVETVVRGRPIALDTAYYALLRNGVLRRTRDNRTVFTNRVYREYFARNLGAPA